jgi:hypothetical protein
VRRHCGPKWSNEKIGARDESAAVHPFWPSGS